MLNHCFNLESVSLLATSVATAVVKTRSAQSQSQSDLGNKATFGKLVPTTRLSKISPLH